MNKSTRIIAGLGAAIIMVAVVAGGLFDWPPRAQAAPATAPEFAGITHWINSRPLTMKSLRGKVVLIDFWAYSCINCLRTLPHVTRWYNEYKDKGLVVIGVHSPEFAFGRHLANVERAVKHFHIDYPVAMDSHMETWQAWHNEFWPAEYLVNRQGQVVLHHFGEGRYLEMENAIRKQLGLPPTSHAEAAGPNFAAMGSPEMYFGTARQRYMANAVRPSSQEMAGVNSGKLGGYMANEQGALPWQHHYFIPAKLRLNQFALGGLWQSTPQFVELVGSHGEIKLHFKSGKLYMVAASDKPVTLQITVDGKPQPPVTVQASKLYTLFDSNNYSEHIVTITIPHPGFRAFTFTFG
ncbi:MAG TPA: redoxin domain-containing protein [Rhodanobacteraceae bacterium]